MDALERDAAGADKREAARRRSLRLVALFEAFKGVLVLLAASGVLALVHHDLAALADSLVRRAHLNPASHYPRIFVEAAEHLQHTHLWWLALGAAAYSALRLAEAYGLWFERAWAEWLAALSGALYVPLELAELLRKPSAMGALVLAANLLVVGVMLWAIYARRRAAAARA